MKPLVLAADLGGTKLSVGWVDAGGKLYSVRQAQVDRSTPHAPIEQIVRLARQGELSAAGRHRNRAVAAAVAVPGLVRQTGTVWAPNLPGWGEMPLARLLASRLAAASGLRVPVIVESDRNAAVLGEAWRGAARGKLDAICLIVGTGIGAGILSGGNLVRGAHELSGCAGWMVVTEEENAAIGKLGCLEALAAGPGIARQARQAVKKAPRGWLARQPLDSINAPLAAEAARRGDRTARRVFRRVGRLLGLAVANLISMFDPDVVVLGGGLAGAADLFLDELTETALSHAQPLAARQVRIRVSRLGRKANLFGAARLAFAQLADVRKIH